jgi:hypothetical protein
MKEIRRGGSRTEKERTKIFHGHENRALTGRTREPVEATKDQIYGCQS